MGYFVLFTNTKMRTGDILWIYMQKDVVEKAFMHSKQCMQPLHARTEIGTSDYNHKERHHRLPEERGSL